MELIKRIAASRQNPYELNNLINDYKPFIASVVQKHIGRFVQFGIDDELSIGLSAFEEAIRAYHEEKGAFLSFAENVIKRRIIDYQRKEARHASVVPLSVYQDKEEDKVIDITAKQAIDHYHYDQIQENRKYEIEEIKKELQSWDMSFFELPGISPKHTETKKLYKEIIEAIINNQELLDKIKTKKYLPVGEVEQLTGIHRKKIERARKYVLAMIIILTGEYKYIQSFINWR